MSYEEVTQWILDLAKGDEMAADKIWCQYFEKLMRHARSKLYGMPLRAFDEEDVALSAMNSFYQGMAENKFDSLRDRDDLWKLLLTITTRKAYRQMRKHYSEKRGGGRVRGDSVFTQGDGEEQTDGIGCVLGTEPTPEFAAEVMENFHSLLHQLDDATLRQVALMTLEGYTIKEIAEKLSYSTRSIDRKLALIREIWTEESQPT